MTEGGGGVKNHEKFNDVICERPLIPAPFLSPLKPRGTYVPLPTYYRPTRNRLKNAYTTYDLGSLTCAVWLFLVHPCAAFAGGEVRCPTILDFS